MSDIPADVLVARRFRVTAEAAPGVLGRLLEPLARRDLVPDAVHAVRDARSGMLHAEMVLEAMPQGMVHLVAGNLGQVIGVLEVSVTACAPAFAAAA